MNPIPYPYNCTNDVTTDKSPIFMLLFFIDESISIIKEKSRIGIQNINSKSPKKANTSEQTVNAEGKKCTTFRAPG